MKRMWGSFAVVLTLAAISTAQESPVAAKPEGTQDNEANRCVEAEFAKYGRPVMFPSRNGVAVGVSTAKTHFKTNEPITAYIWLRNDSRPKMQTYSCCEQTFLFSIQLLDASGHPLMDANNVSEMRKRGGWGCGCSSGIRDIHPGFCGVIDSGTLNRADTAYSLTPGEYKIVEREDGSAAQGQQARRTDERPALVITIER